MSFIPLHSQHVYECIIAEMLVSSEHVLLKEVLTLVSNERIPFTPTMRMLLEIQEIFFCFEGRAFAYLSFVILNFWRILLFLPFKPGYEACQSSNCVARWRPVHQ